MALLLIIVGALFGPIPFIILAATMDVRAATGWQVALFLIGFGNHIRVVVAWMRRCQFTFADLGWGPHMRRVFGMRWMFSAS